MDWSQLGLSDEELATFRDAALAGQALLRGRIDPKTYDSFGNLGLFVATEGWQAATANETTGSFVRLYDNGIRCLTFPCFSIHEARLNSGRHRNISGVNFDAVGASSEQIAMAFNAILMDSLLAVGVNVVIPKAGPAGTGVDFVASQFYLRVGH